jgi:transcription elongation GreA/GreB family factor
MRFSLFSREVIPFFLQLAMLGLAALAIDALLHWLDAVWIGRYLGIPGVLLIIGSFGYSLRKRKLITTGKPVTLLRLHERMAWAGSLLILVHAGIHFNALLGWLAVWAMLVNIASGLTGKFLLQRARIRLEETRTQMRAQGLSSAELEDKLSRAEVIDVSKLSGSTIKFGATVTVVDEDTDEEKAYQIVGESEADVKSGRVSLTSPIARALIGKKAGDTVEVKTPGGGKSYEILKVAFV